MFDIIDSASNPKIKHTCKLAVSSKYRKECGKFFLEGLRLCLEVSRSKTKTECVFFTEKAYNKNRSMIDEIIDCASASYQISQSISDKLSQTENNQGVFCVCEWNDEKDETSISFKKKYIALDRIQNPDNLGAISRTAEALGISGIIINGGCDIYNPKALRASMGSLLRIPVIKTDNLVPCLLRLHKNGMKIYATTPDSEAYDITGVDMSGGVVTVMGNEANGVSDEIFSVSEKVTIPMAGLAESLNAAMAAAITMWEMMRGR